MAFGLGILIGCLGIGTAFAGGHGKKESKQKGSPGRASEQHRSERAVERSNAQWSEGAMRGQERADEVRNDRAKQKGQKEKKAKRDKKAKPDDREDPDESGDDERDGVVPTDG